MFKKDEQISSLVRDHGCGEVSHRSPNQQHEGLNTKYDSRDKS